MSIFSALNTAVSGLSAQAHAFTDISNNISNSQTIGYKATDTDFSDYVLNSSAAQGTSETVRASTAAENETQGSITSSSNALALAISGSGFFNVAEDSGDSTASTKTFQPTDYFTRNGNFSEDNQGYLVNSSNEYLKAYAVNSDGTLDTTKLDPINVSGVTFRPTQTNAITYDASLPGSTAAADPTATTAATTQSQTIYDSTGKQHTLAMSWTPSGNNSWTVSASIDGASTPAASARVTFDAKGLVSSVTQTVPASSANTTNAVSGSSAGFTIPATLGGVSQPMTVTLGTIGSTSGTTMATDANSTGNAATIQTDSVTSGSYTGISMTADGNIMANFDNDHSQLIGKVPLATFANANALTAHDGEAYTATSGSGAAVESLAGQNGAGTLETSSVENSTTSLDTDLTKLITAQQAYGANAKVVTTANDMLQTVLAMKQ